jgi:hypothetical protein
MTTDATPLALDRRLALGDWVVPGEIVLDNAQDRLVWRYRVGSGPPRRRRPREHPLESFLELAEAPAEDILNYAKRYGVLYICEHDLPSSHTRSPFSPIERLVRVSPHVSALPGAAGPATGWFDRCRLRELSPGTYWEPIAAWRRYAQKAASLLHVGAALHSGQVGLEEDWVQLGWRAIPRLTEVRTLAALEVQEWIDVGRVQPLLSWGARGLAITIGGESLFGALAAQLLFAIGRTDLAFCKNCARPFNPTRRGRRYCEECGIKPAWREASRRYRRSPTYRNRRREATRAD